MGGSTGGAPSPEQPMQGMPSAPGGMAPQGPLGQPNPQLQDWRQSLQSHQPGGMDDWQRWMERQRPQYSGGRHNTFRGGLGRRPITNAGSFSAAATHGGGPGEEITAPAAVAGAPQDGLGGNAPPAQGGGGGQPSSQDIIQALRSRFGGQ